LCIIGSGPQERGGAVGPQRQAAQRLGDEPDLTRPALHRNVHGQMHLDGAAASPVGKFLVVQEVVARARPGDQRHPAEPVAVGQRAEHHGAQRGQPDPAGDDDEITADGLGQTPVGAERPAHPDHGARLRVVQRPAHRANRADRVRDAVVGDGRHSADRDGDLADTERVHHHELAG
jgi:hypothetical protein